MFSLPFFPYPHHILHLLHISPLSISDRKDREMAPGPWLEGLLRDGGKGGNDEMAAAAVPLALTGLVLGGACACVLVAPSCMCDA